MKKPKYDYHIYCYLDDCIFHAFIQQIKLQHAQQQRGNMNNYELMKLSETADDDAYEQDEVEEKEIGSEAENFKRKYKEFYTDIKLSHKEDW